MSVAVKNQIISTDYLKQVHLLSIINPNGSAIDERQETKS